MCDRFEYASVVIPTGKNCSAAITCCVWYFAAIWNESLCMSNVCCLCWLHFYLVTFVGYIFKLIKVLDLFVSSMCLALKYHKTSLFF